MGRNRPLRPTWERPAAKRAAPWRAIVHCLILAVGLTGCAYTRGAHESAEAPVEFPPAVGPRHSVQVVEIGIPAKDLRDNPGLADARVGFGLSSMLVEALADSGRFDLVESEKAILKRHRALWQRTEEGFYAEDRPPVGLKPSEYQVRAQVSYSRFSRRGIAIGPFTSQKETLRVSVRVCLRAAATGEELCREGQGEAEQQAGGAIYEYRGDRQEFEKTAAGLATRRAVRQAVVHLVEALPTPG